MRFIRWLWQNPGSDNEWGQFVAAFFYKSLLLLLLMLFILLIAIFLLPDSDLSRLPVLLTLATLNLITLILLKRTYLRQSLHFFIWTVWPLIAYASFTSIGVYTPAYLSSIFLLLMAGMGLSRRSTILLTALVIGAGLPMVYGHAQGWISTPLNHNMLPLPMWITTSAIYIVVAYVVLAIRKTSFAIVERSQREQAFYRAIVEDQTELIVRWKEGGIRTFANKAYLKYFGLSEEQAIGSSYFPQVNNDDHQWIFEKIAHLSLENPIDTGEHRVIRPDGSQGWQEWSDRALFDENGKLIEYQSVGRDITALKELEDRQRELVLAQERESFLRDFLSAMSHDLQTPLSVMRTNLYMLKRSPEKSEERIAKIDRQIDKLSGMIDDILTVARLENIPELECVPTDFSTILESSLNSLRDEARLKQITLDSPAVLPPALINANSQALQRALNNLLSNAIKYTPVGGKVTLEIRRVEAELCIDIVDTGIGIDAEDLPHVFERFYRAKNAKNFEKGTGLGLAIVNRIIELHKGSISVSSQIGLGSRFSIKLPLLQEAALV